MLLPMPASVASDAGAGTLVYVGRFDLAEFAVVLEPEEPLEIARRALLCRPRRARRLALARACAAREADRVRLARRGARRRRTCRGSAARLAAEARRERAAGMAGVRRHDPHRGDGRGRTGLASALGGARARRASRISAPAGWWRASRDISWSRSTPGRKRASAKWRRIISPGLRQAKAGCAENLDSNGDLLVRRMWPVAVAPSVRSLVHASSSTVVARSATGAAAAPMRASAHHPARSLGYLRVRARGRAGRMGGVGRLHVLGRRSRGA